jgi:DNA helicase-2/ATP-dependent DNA helicase PcrA
MWDSEKTIEARGRVENLKELSTALASFDNMEEFLEHVSLISDSDDAIQAEMVSIMTIHGSKGLEFKNIFLPGWEEGLFPSQQTIDESGKEGLEEERRLAYVAITRAKQRLTISFSSSRMVFGNIISSIPSRFIDELPKENIEIINNAKGRGPGYNTDRQSRFGEREKKSNFIIPSSDNGFATGEKKKIKLFEDNKKFSIGDKVVHSDFGVGRIISVNGRHLQIVFEKSAIKTVLDDFVEKAA